MNQIELSRGEKRYLGEELEKVSRSFAIVIPSLEEPFNYYMATAYLICRVVDNIEDCTQPFAWKEERFQEFHQLINEPATGPDILAGWGQEAWPALTKDETELMGPIAGLPLWEIYAKIPDSDRASIRRWVAEMAKGMLRIEGPGQDEMLRNYGDTRVLARESDYNEYCFYVAGTVGHMATELTVLQYGLSDEIAARLNATCEACGRGLQKTNIIKGFAEDLGRGISYLPYTWHQEADFSALQLTGAPIEWTRMVIGDVVHELRDATEYVLALPYHAKGYRMASLMSLLPAYQTLLLAAKKHSALFTPNHHVKISRPVMAKCKVDAKLMLRNNDSVMRYRDRLEQKIDQVLTAQLAL